jgi:hyperosmotically inducible protein
MKVPRLFCGVIALAVLGAGCHRAPSQEQVQQTASEAAAKVKVETAKAKDQLSDLWLATKIHSKFVGDHDISARDISVSSEDGVITLKGKVLNEPMRQLAVTIAKNTDGVTQVVNQLDVEVVGPIASQQARGGATPGAVATSGTLESANASAVGDDARITAMIQSKYFQDDRIKGRHINVASNDGVITLNGEVADDTERAQALLLARTTDGVKRVEDALTVTTTSTLPSSATEQPSAYVQPSANAAAANGDDALSARVQSQLSGDARLKGAPVEVTAKNGVILLQGTVGSAAAKQRVLSLARGTDGVTQVVDRLRVGKAKK